MKNRFFATNAGIIALLLLVLCPLSMSAQAGITTDRNVLFLHGLNNTSTAWQPFSNQFIANNRRMTSNNQTYGTVGSLATIFSGVSTTGSGASSIAISHSLGGVVARNLDRANPGTFVGGIITVGSPLDGATIANSVLDGRAATAIADGTSTMLRGPYATLGIWLGPLFTLGADVVTAVALPEFIQIFLLVDNFNNLGTMADLQVGGTGIEQEKSAAPTATPKISIWGNEETPTHWNILATMTKKNVVGIADATSDYYDIMYWSHLAVGCSNWWNAWGWWNFYASYEWYAGSDWIENDSERVWNHIIRADLVGTQCFQTNASFCQYVGAGCDDTPGQWGNCRVECSSIVTTHCVTVHSMGQSDSWIPATSQRGEGSNSWRVANGAVSDEVVKIPALGVNHFEEIDANNVTMQGIFADIFAGNHGPQFRINRR